MLVASPLWATTCEPLLPSNYLDDALNDVQPLLFNPTMSNVILLTAETNAFGNAEMKKCARQRMDIIYGNAKIYSKWLNTPEKMRKTADHS